MTRKLVYILIITMLEGSGYGTLWYFAGFHTALGVFLIHAAINIRIRCKL